LDDVVLFKKALLVVALSFLLYNIYQATVATLFISHFPTIVAQLPKFIESSQPNLQLGLFIFQELAATVGSYLRLIGAVFAFSASVLFFRKNPKYLNRFRWALLVESLYFALLFPAALNHLVGSVISSSAFLNFYTGVSNLLQATLIFPPLFMLSRKLKNPQDVASILKWAGIAAPLYVLGFWVRNVLMWVYAISPAENPQIGFFETVGFVNSSVTLLVAAVVCAMVFLIFRKKNTFNIKLACTALILVGCYFLVYDLVAVWNPVYRAFLPLTDFWMISLLTVGIGALLGSEEQ
jgi:hypothetical protein